MKRRLPKASTGPTAAQPGIGGQESSQRAAKPQALQPTEVRLAGMSLAELRQSLYDELFQVFLPFWDKHGIDHENGGVMCNLDYDGTRLNTEKLLWFQGRAIWVYSFLYNHFGKIPKYLEVAGKIKEFLFKYALQEDGWWAEALSQEGKALRPFSGDTEGMYFIVEGLQEYAAATGDEQSRETAFALLKRLFRDFDRADFRYRGADFRHLWSEGAGDPAPGSVDGDSLRRHPDAEAMGRSGNRGHRGPRRGRDPEQTLQP